MIPVVVHPLPEQLIDAQRADVRMDAGPRKVIRGERPYERDPVFAKRDEFVDQLARVAQMVPARLGDGRRVP